MKINWHSSRKLDASILQEKLKLEYNFRQRVLKLLIENNIPECCEDYSCAVFDFYVDENLFIISKDTHEPFYSIFSLVSNTVNCNETG